MPSQEAKSAAVLNAAPLSLLLSVLFMVVLAMCGPSAICVPEMMVEGEQRLQGNVRPLIFFPLFYEFLGDRTDCVMGESTGLSPLCLITCSLPYTSHRRKLMRGTVPTHRTSILIRTPSPLDMFPSRTQISKCLGYRPQGRRWGWRRSGGRCEGTERRERPGGG